MISSLRHWNTHYAKSSEDRAMFYLAWIKKHSTIIDEITLDIGCSTGVFSTAINKVGGTAISLDIGYKKNTEANLNYLTADATMLPIRSNIIKNVFSSDVYEHIPEQDKFLAENSRVMKKDGFSFFSTGNRFFPIDRHTGFPFIDLLPRWLASAWARTQKNRQEYDVYEPDYYELRKKLGKVSSRYIVNFDMFIDFYKLVYPHLYKPHWIKIARLLDKVGLLKLVTPKYYVVFKRGLVP